MFKYYAGIGSREIPDEIFNKMYRIAELLEKQDYILRSGGAKGSDTAFEQGVKNPKNMNIFLPFPLFNGKKDNGWSHLYIDKNDRDNYCKAYESLILHPRGFKLSIQAREMMLRNYFQHSGLVGEGKSHFIICYTKDGANGTSIPTSYDSGGTGQAIRIAAKNNTPVYNLKDGRYYGKSPEELVDLILNNLSNNINPDSIKELKSTKLF